MRLVNIKERMPTKEDGDSAGEVVWVLVAVHHDDSKSVFSAHDDWKQVGLDNFVSRHGLDPSCGDVEIFWLDINHTDIPITFNTQASSHVRKVEL